MEHSTRTTPCARARTLVGAGASCVKVSSLAGVPNQVSDPPHSRLYWNYRHPTIAPRPDMVLVFHPIPASGQKTTTALVPRQPRQVVCSSDAEHGTKSRRQRRNLIKIRISDGNSTKRCHVSSDTFFRCVHNNAGVDPWSGQG